MAIEITEKNLAITVGNDAPGVHAARMIGLLILVLLPLYFFWLSGRRCRQERSLFFRYTRSALVSLACDANARRCDDFLFSRGLGDGDGAVQYSGIAYIGFSQTVARIAVVDKHRVRCRADESSREICI